MMYPQKRYLPQTKCQRPDLQNLNPDSNQDKSDEWKEIFGLHLNRESEKWKVIFGLGYISGTISKMTACDRDLSFTLLSI